MKSRIDPMFGFKVFKHAAVTLTGIEVLNRIHKGQFTLGFGRSGSNCAPHLERSAPDLRLGPLHRSLLPSPEIRTRAAEVVCSP